LRRTFTRSFRVYKKTYNYEIMSTSKAIIKDFDGTNWLVWNQQAKGHYTKKKVSIGGRSYWTMLQEEDPKIAGKKVIITTDITQVQRTVLIGIGQVVPMVDQNGNPVCDDVSSEVETEETEQVFQARCQEWTTVMDAIWSDFLGCASGEAAVLLKQVQDSDGQGAWKSFVGRWGGVSITTTMAALESLLDYHPKSVSMAQHTTGWREVIRQLKLRNIPLDDLPELESMLFLRTLPKKYHDFVTNKKLQPEQLKEPAQLYQAAVDWAGTIDKDDEANTSGAALFGGAQQPPFKRQKSGGHDSRECFNCHKLGHIQAECTNPCAVCGHDGHTKNSCHATKHKNGHAIERTRIGKGGRGRGKGGRGKGGRGKGGGGKAFLTHQGQQKQWFEAGKQAAELAAAIATNKAMEKKASDLGMSEAFGFATPVIGEGTGSEVGEALECLSLRDTVVLKVDSGADTHYVTDDVQLEESQVVDRKVYTARKGDVLTVGEEGVLGGTVDSSSGDTTIEINARKSSDFSFNLFSVREAVRSGHTVTFAPEGAFISASDGTQLPLRTTRSGWELHLRGCSEQHGLACTADNVDVSFTQPERQSAAPQSSE
jgi:hypothetical protein